MADIASRPLAVPRMPWRTMVMAILVIALLLATALAYVGSQRPNVPAPFGPARNGLIVYSVYGDIYTADPATGSATAVVADPDTRDTNPVFSRDGTRFAFLRSTGSGTEYDLMVADADGSGVRVVPGSPIRGMDAATDPDVEWAPDSRSLIVYSEPRILRLDAVGSAAPVVISEDAVPTGRVGPTGLIPYQPVSIAADALWVVGIDGSAPREILRLPAADGSLGEVQPSPDGTMLAFVQGLPGDQWRIHVVNNDGTGVRRLTSEMGPGVEGGFAWSPDSRRIAFSRWTPDDPARTDLGWSPLPLGVVSVDAGTAASPVRGVGPAGVSEGLMVEWSPDGSTIVAIPARHESTTLLNPPFIIDVATGDSHELDVVTNTPPSWQRLAP